MELLYWRGRTITCANSDSVAIVAIFFIDYFFICFFIIPPISIANSHFANTYTLIADAYLFHPAVSNPTADRSKPHLLSFTTGPRPLTPRRGLAVNSSIVLADSCLDESNTILLVETAYVTPVN